LIVFALLESFQAYLRPTVDQTNDQGSAHEGDGFNARSER